MTARTITVTAALFAVGLAAGWGLYAVSNQPPAATELNRELEATVLPADHTRIPDVALQTASGTFSRGDLGQSWTFLFFGFTHCPDVCPTTLQRMSIALDEIRTVSDTNPRVLFVSVDYRRDSPQSASDYASAFGQRFVGATANEPVLRRLVDSVNATFSLPEDSGSGNYPVQHSSAVFLLAPQGRIRAIFGSPQNPDTVAKEFLQIRQAFS